MIISINSESPQDNRRRVVEYFRSIDNSIGDVLNIILPSNVASFQVKDDRSFELQFDLEGKNILDLHPNTAAYVASRAASIASLFSNRYRFNPEDYRYRISFETEVTGSLKDHGIEFDSQKVHYIKVLPATEHSVPDKQVIRVTKTEGKLDVKVEGDELLDLNTLVQHQNFLASDWKTRDAIEHS